MADRSKSESQSRSLPIMRLCQGFCALALLFLTQCGEQRINHSIAALSDPCRVIRRQASYELVMIGAPAVEPLMAAAASGSDSLRYISVQILGRIGDRRSVPFLQEHSGHPNPFVRREAVLALGKMGDRDLIPLLGHALMADSADSVRAAAAQSLANFRDTSAVALLLPGLTDTVVAVRQQALVSLYRLWTPAAEQAVIQALDDPDETIRFIAAQILGQRQAQNSREALCAALHDDSVWVRTEAARALGELGDPEAVDSLLELLSQSQGADHAAARQALRRLTGVEYVLLP